MSSRVAPRQRRAFDRSGSVAASLKFGGGGTDGCEMAFVEEGLEAVAGRKTGPLIVGIDNHQDVAVLGACRHFIADARAIEDPEGVEAEIVTGVEIDGDEVEGKLGEGFAKTCEFPFELLVIGEIEEGGVVADPRIEAGNRSEPTFELGKRESTARASCLMFDGRIGTVRTAHSGSE